MRWPRIGQGVRRQQRDDRQLPRRSGVGRVRADALGRVGVPDRARPASVKYAISCSSSHNRRDARRNAPAKRRRRSPAGRTVQPSARRSRTPLCTIDGGGLALVARRGRATPSLLQSTFTDSKTVVSPQGGSLNWLGESDACQPTSWPLSVAKFPSCRVTSRSRRVSLSKVIGIRRTSPQRAYSMTSAQRIQHEHPQSCSWHPQPHP